MSPFELAVATDDLKLEIKSALERARRMGFRAVDVGASQGPVSPGELSTSGRRHFLRHLSDLGLGLRSLRGPTAGAGYADGAAGERRLETAKSVLALASDLKVPVVSTTLGGFSSKDAEGQSVRLIEALAALADAADQYGVTLAIESAGINANDLAALVKQINCPNLAACCDSGAMLIQGENPHRIADALAGRVRLVRARDAVIGASNAPGHETALGSGQLDPASFIASLIESGYQGPLILTRQSGASPVADLTAAREVFENILRPDMG